MTVDECLEQLDNYHQQVMGFGTMSDDYYDNVAQHWFHNVAPVKVREYGVDCWQRLGPRGFVVNMSAMRYRWAHMGSLESYTDADMDNCIWDAFGFSMLFNLCLGIKRLIFDSALIHPSDDDEWIIGNLWNRPVGPYSDLDPIPDDKLFPLVGLRALRMAYNMYVLQ